MSNSDLTRVLDALLDAIADRVVEKLASQQAPKPSGGLVGKLEICRLLDCSAATLQRMALDGMPFVQVGKTRRYDVDACRAWCEAQTAKPKPRPRENQPSVDGVRLLSRLGTR